MDAYVYAVTGAAYSLRISPYESHLHSRLDDPHGWVVFAPNRADLEMIIPRAKLLHSAQKLLCHIEAELDLLGYRYSIETRGMPNGVEQSGGGGLGCTLRGESAIAEAGPGYCHISAARKELREDPGRRRLADMRDMKPITTDEGVLLIPKRRKRPITLDQQLRGLIEFLNNQTAQTVEQTVTEHVQ